ncbi:NAD(P)H-quinone dehydrogenase [Aurantimicrobium sp. MWH-Uga1]|uniref:NAD(P)H-quinone dehydrogenase n=1 Tax=Aurantimicrobium sp. MWH-Uga1 TaxID=2079575 RepID=UPI000DEDAE0E|nr:NAD(P)H-quinone dehydrogenase [Aurantimicrobium sp. MWH-Uga1]AXE54977.1 NAD(P)H dehydrogenase (quinone) [Aurantimicrobium sp. MWH-Uga1]
MSFEFERKQRIAILGGGPGGYEAALAAAQLGAEVTLIERSGIGGAAVLTDVVPSKTLIATAEFTSTLERSSELGVTYFVTGEDKKAQKPEIAINLATVNKRLLGLAHDTSEDMKLALKEAGVNVIPGHGRLDGTHAVIASTGPGGTDFDRVEADTIIVSVGASPRVLDTAKPDGERILTWTQLYNLTELPEHMIVVGSGVTGAEFASAYSSLGSKVTLVSSRDTVLPGEDADAAAVLEDVFVRRGMTLMSKARMQSVERTKSGVFVTLADGRTVEGSHCLIAVGSIPNTANLGLEDAGVELDDAGRIVVNRVARSSVPNIYGVGDCSAALPLASVAMMQGRTAAFHALGDAVTPFDERNVAANIFTQPEVASVGWSQAEIEQGIIRGTVYKLPLTANPRAKMQGIRDGFVKLITTTTSRTVIGGVVVAPRASELIFPIALAVEHRLTVDDVAKSFAIYPSISGSIVDAARALHQVERK